MSLPYVNPKTFTHLNSASGLDFLRNSQDVMVGKFSVDINSELVQKILNFINGKNYNLKILKDSHHAFLWDSECEDSNTVKENTIRKILNPDSYLHIKSYKSLSDYFYQVSQHLMGDTCSGLEIFKNAESRIKISNMDFLRQNKIKFIQKTIKDHLQGENSFLFAPEYDFGNLDFKEENIECLILDPKIHEGNNGKAFFYRKGINVKEYNQEYTMRLLQEAYSEDILKSYEIFKDKFSLVEMDGLVLILVHLKSIGSSKDLEKNRKLYSFMCQVRNIFQNIPTIMMGDFNLPLPSEENGHLNLQDHHFENYQLRDEENWFQWFYRKARNMFFQDSEEFMNKGFTRAVYNPTHVIGKSRSDNGFLNSQVYRNKFYQDRKYNTDQIFFNFPNDNRTQISPRRSEVPLLPYIGKNLDGSDSHLSDHQILHSNFTFEGVEYQASVFNVMADCCSNPPPLVEGLTDVEYQSLEIEYSIMMYDIYQSIKVV